MIASPHKLFRIIPGSSYQDENGDFITSDPTKEYVCDCFLHNISVKERIGLNGVGVKASHYVNMPRRDDLEYNIEVEVYEGELLRGKGKIVDIKHTSRVGNYTTIYI